MNPSHSASGESTAAILPAQGGAWAQTPQSPAGGWEKKSEYYLPHYQKAPTGEKGETLVELQTQPAQPSKEGLAIAELP